MNILKLKIKSLESFIYLGLLLFLGNSCIKEKINLDNISSDSQINGAIAVPIAYGELSM